MNTLKILLLILCLSICTGIHASNYQLTTKALTVASSGGEKYFNLTCDTIWQLTSK
jgi:hypothetical protein